MSKRGPLPEKPFLVTVEVIAPLPLSGHYVGIFKAKTYGKAVDRGMDAVMDTYPDVGEMVGSCIQWVGDASLIPTGTIGRASSSRGVA